MKIWVRFLVLVVFAVGVVIAIQPLTAQAQTAAYVRELYKKMEANRQSLKTLKANIREIKLDKQIGVDETRAGALMVIPGSGRSANFKIDWTYPAQETLSVVNGKYEIYIPRQNRVIEGNTKEIEKKQDVGGGLNIITMSERELKENFTAEWLDPETVANVYSTFHLRLTPKKPASYKHADVWVDKEGMPVQVRLTAKNNDETTYLLLDIKRNTNISAKDLALKVNGKPERVKG